MTSGSNVSDQLEIYEDHTQTSKKNEHDSQCYSAPQRPGKYQKSVAPHECSESVSELETLLEPLAVAAHGPEADFEILSERADLYGPIQGPVEEKAKDVERGRTFQRILKTTNPFDRAESRKRKNDATVEIDVRCVKARVCRTSTLFEDPTDLCAALNDKLLEPSPHVPICRFVTQVLEEAPREDQIGVETPRSLIEDLDTNTYSRLNSNRPTFGQVGLDEDTNSLWAAWASMPNGVELSNADHELYGGIDSLSLVPVAVFLSPVRPAANSQLPAEVLYKIYWNLAPSDFNSARHTCRSWYINSLDRALLENMLKRGGWASYIHQELYLNSRLHPHGLKKNEWHLSKRIARECALGSDWTGNGISSRRESPQGILSNHEPRKTAFVKLSTTNFTEAGVHYPGAQKQLSGLSFTVSSCGKFLMVAHGCLVSIYELNCSHKGGEALDSRENGSLRPVTSVICPRRVLACSMDTSSQRYAIAALLDGRMGLVCDLTIMNEHSRRRSSLKYQRLQGGPVLNGSEYQNRVSISSSRPRRPKRGQAEQRFVFPVIAAESSPRVPFEFQQGVWQNLAQSHVSSVSNTISSPAIDHVHQSLAFQAHTSMPVEPSTPTIYAPLCSADDLPRSVALCPQRRCVAFGCSSGIELHWVDALTGQDLNRWFPLTAPSDYLYFLPPRAGIDSAKKLRLISSAGRPSTRPAIAAKFTSGRKGSIDEEKSKTTPVWDLLRSSYSGNVVNSTRPAIEPRDNSDHYRAVPLNDGYHILFTDPSSGSLCLGSDAPLGGPSKLLRKMWFAGPQGRGSPVAYAAGSDLRWGVRIVAAYEEGSEQSIWLFSIPADVFASCQIGRGRENSQLSGLSLATEDGDCEWLEWWSDKDPCDPAEAGHASLQGTSNKNKKLWPIHIRGQKIGTCSGLMDLAIDAGPNMTIWAFGADGIAKTWHLGELEDEAAQKHYHVMRDGTIRETDAGGDTPMPDEPSSVPLCPTASDRPDQSTFDGCASIRGSRILGKQPPPYHEKESWQDSTTCDADGDVLMAEFASSDAGISDQASDDSFDAFAMAHNSREIVYHNYSAADCSYPAFEGREAADLVDVLTGVARIEIEIR